MLLSMEKTRKRERERERERCNDLVNVCPVNIILFAHNIHSVVVHILIIVLFGVCVCVYIYKYIPKIGHYHHHQQQQKSYGTCV